MAELITREDAIKYLCKNITWYDEDGNIADDDVKLDQITDIVYGIQGVEERKQGEWIESMYRTYVCSNCGENPTKGTGVTLTLTHLNYEYKYCRFCGAKMRGK